MKNNWKNVRLDELLNKKDLEIVRMYINKQDFDKLRYFLNSIKDKLKPKGVLPDYLYYALVNQIWRGK